MSSALEAAVKLLSGRAHAAAELRRKLRDKGFSQTDAAGAVSECQRLGFLDDATLARDISEDMLRRGCGPRKIAAKLSKKGVAKELAKEAFESVSAKDDVPDLPEAAKEALSRKLRSFERESDPAKRKAKALRFLAGRGFDSNTSFKALEAFPALFKRGFQPGGIPDED